MTEDGGHLGDDDAESHRVHILAEEVEEDPVSDGTAKGQQVGVVLVRRCQTRTHDGGAQRRQRQNGGAVGEIQTGDDGQNDEPEPNERVDLLVHDIQGQDAHGVVLLYRTCCSI